MAQDGAFEKKVLLLKALIEVALKGPADQNQTVDFFVCDPTGDLDTPLPETWIPWSVKQTVLGLKDSVTLEPVISALQVGQPPASPLIFCPFTSGKQEAKQVAAEWLGPNESRWRGAQSSLDLLLERFPKDGSSAALVLPAHLLSLRSASKTRKKLVDSGLLRCVIEFDHLPEFLLSRRVMNIQASLCILNSDNRDGLVRLWKAPSDFKNPQRVAEDLQKLLQQPAGRTRYGFVICEQIDEDEPLTFDSCHPQVAEDAEKLADFGDKKSLGEICEVFIGRPPIPVSSEEVKKKRTPRKGPLCITGAQITDSGSLELSRAKNFPGRAREQDLLREGDLCFGAIFGGKNLRVAQITGDQAQKNFMASHSLVVVRPPESFSEAERRFLLAYLRSKRAANFLAIKSPSISIDLMAVKALPVPRPDEEFQHQITELLEAAQNFENLKADADSALDDLFDFESVDDARLHILSTGRRTKVCSEAASAATKFENLVRTQFPHPLALRWRRVEASKDDLAGYIEILQCGETLLCYLASLCVVTARESGKVIQAVGNLSEMLTKRGGGVSLGDWIAILRETNTSKAFRDSHVSSLLYEITNFIVPETDRAIQRLSELRNDQAHGRGPTAPDLSAFCLEAKALLETLFKAASFLTDYPLIFIEETARDSLEGITRYKYRKLVGDHHLVPLEEAQHESCEIDKGALYLIDKRGDLVGLRPMVIRQACPECGTWATFHLENFHKKKGLFEIKAFEHGHTTEYPSSRHFEIFGFGG